MMSPMRALCVLVLLAVTCSPCCSSFDLLNLFGAKTSATTRVGRNQN